MTNVYGQSTIPEKVLICGVCKNVEQAVPVTIQSIGELGSRFLDYHVVIYENNSTDKTKELMQQWAHNKPHVTFLSETLTQQQLDHACEMKVANRTELIAMARNKVLDVAMLPQY